MINKPDTRALVCLFLGFFVLAFGLSSRTLKERLFLSEPLLSTLFGVLLSPRFLNLLWFFPKGWDQALVQDEARETLIWFCRIIIGIQVLFAASTLPSRWLLQRASVKSMAVMLLPVMTTGWIISSLLVKACLHHTTWANAFIIGACIAPTDPVLANSVVKGIYAERNIPTQVRELLVAESGLNDGFGTPFLFIPILSVLNAFNPVATAKAFILRIVIYDVLLGSMLGVVIGYVARKGLKIARRNETIDRESMLVFTVALALFTIGAGEVLGTNGLLACFFAGTALNWTDRIRAEDLHSHFSEGVELFFDSSVFLVLGTILPFDTWIDPTFLPLPNLIILGVLVLLLRRLPVVLLLWRVTPLVNTWKEAAFTGYFGPIGIGALYYALMATDKLPDDSTKQNDIIGTTTFIVFCSIIVHGTSAPLIMLVRKMPSPFTIDQATWSPARSAEENAPNETDALLGNETSHPRSQGPAKNYTNVRRTTTDGITGQHNPRDVLVTGQHERQAYSAMDDAGRHRHRIARLGNSEGVDVRQDV